MSPAVVHQTLHGYSDGHRLIAGSPTLSSADARTMQVMSDLSGPGVKPAASGYLTGYPLEGSGRYVLARTWAAPEMSRPGCVWTHSLIIENADLATMSSAAGLLAAFRRPDMPPLRDEYASLLQVPAAPDPEPPLTRSTAARPNEVLNALYMAPTNSVVVQAGDAGDDERLATAIWMQQWPRLRRTFGFCTLTKVDRSLRGEALDLQMVPGSERQFRSKFKDAVNPSDVAFDPVIETLWTDLFNPGVSNLREFLRRTGGDVEGGRRAMVPLVMLYNAIFAGALDLSSAVNAFQLLDRLGRRQARSLRLIVARQALEQVDQVDDEIFEFLLDALEEDFGSTENADLTKQFGTALWRRSPVRFVDALSESGPVGRAVEDAVSRIDAEELVTRLGDNASAADRIARRRPDVMSRPEFWRIDGVDESLAMTVDDADVADVARALIVTGRSDSARGLISRAEPAGLAAALEVARSDGTAASAWLQVLARNPNKAAAVLATGRLRRSALVTLARAMEPDDVPDDYPEDPWWTAFRSSKGKLSKTDEDYLSVFLLSRALGRRSRSVAHLLRHTYTTVHQALSRGRLPYDVERFVTARLKWGSWLEWDRVSRLRTTVVDRFVDDHLDPKTFGLLSRDGAIAKDLINEAARTARGRQYLDEVRRQLEQASEKGIRARGHYIAKKISWPD